MNRMKEDNLCPECSGKITNSNHESYCMKCGLVTDDSPVDDDDLSFDSDGNVMSERTGPPTKMWERISSMI